MGWVRYITPGAGWMERETDGETGGGRVGMFHVACALGLQVFIIFYKSSVVVKSLLKNMWKTAADRFDPRFSTSLIGQLKEVD